MILATVYIITYKRFDSIYKTIDSALNQNYSNIELFVSDDGSPNFPYKDIVRYIESNKKENIVSYHVLDNKENVGTVKHINKILKQANGDLYIPLAGDDSYFDNNVVRRIVERYEQTHFKVLATSRAVYIDEDKYISLLPHYKYRERIAKKMSTARQQHKKFTECKMMDFASGSAMAYEANFLKMMGFFDEKYRLWEDGPFINKVTSMGYVITTAYDIVSIKYRGGGVSSDGNPIMLADIELFNSKDRWINANSYGFFHRRILKYTMLKYRHYSLITKYFIRLLYLDAVIDQINYKMQEKFVVKEDTVHINITSEIWKSHHLACF